jgi:hypothetical protein
MRAAYAFNTAFQKNSTGTGMMRFAGTPAANYFITYEHFQLISIMHISHKRQSQSEGAAKAAVLTEEQHDQQTLTGHTDTFLGHQ